ncbi:MAG: aspartate aminotransferase family protein [Armatimonadetes bacterium]|nr:aspartate aminotransferase family protein [Armatimonadota bacterium]
MEQATVTGQEWLDLPEVLSQEQYELYLRQWMEEQDLHMNSMIPSSLEATGHCIVEWRAEGIHVYDPRGEGYFDCLGAGGVFGLGFRHPRVLEAVKKQLDRMALSTRMGVVPGQTAVARKLNALVPDWDLPYIFLGSSGTEAVEAAIKLARIATRRPGLVGAREGYHGMSIGTISVSGLRLWRDGIEPGVGATRLVPHGNIDALRSVVDRTTAAVILEPIPWASGCIVPPADYFSQVRQLCDEHGALLIADEIQTGLGRTGEIFALKHWNVRPDILCVGKVLSGGLVPVAATMFSRRVKRVEEARPLFNNSSFGGNPLACAAASATLDVLVQEGLFEQARQLGEQLGHGFDELPADLPEVFSGQHGLGLMRCIETTHPIYGALLQDILLKQHRIMVASMLHLPQLVRVSPPFISTPEDIDRLLGAFRAAGNQLRELGPEAAQARLAEVYQKVIATHQARRSS